MVVTLSPAECGPELLSDGKTLGSVVDHSPSSAEVKTEWDYISIAPIYCVYCHDVDMNSLI